MCIYTYHTSTPFPTISPAVESIVTRRKLYINLKKVNAKNAFVRQTANPQLIILSHEQKPKLQKFVNNMRFTQDEISQHQ